MHSGLQIWYSLTWGQHFFVSFHSSSSVKEWIDFQINTMLGSSPLIHDKIVYGMGIACRFTLFYLTIDQARKNGQPIILKLRNACKWQRWIFISSFDWISNETYLLTNCAGKSFSFSKHLICPCPSVAWHVVQASLITVLPDPSPTPSCSVCIAYYSTPPCDLSFMMWYFWPWPLGHVLTDPSYIRIW